MNTNQLLLLVLIWAVNFAISWWNAKSVGVVWVETKQIGGWQRFMSWMGAIMSASGFTWCYLVVLLFGAYYAQPFFIEKGKEMILTPDALEAGFALGYLIIIPGVFFSGFMIWIDSLAIAWRNKSAKSIGIAGWNTFAQAHNMYSAMRGVPEAMESVTKFFFGKGKSKDSKNGAGLIIILLVILAILGGIITTMSIVKKYAGSRPLPLRKF